MKAIPLSSDNLTKSNLSAKIFMLQSISKITKVFSVVIPRRMQNGFTLCRKPHISHS